MYKIKKDIISAKRPTASVRAKPKIAFRNNSFLIPGFLETPSINEPNTTPTPAPAPTKPIVARPAPINFEEDKIVRFVSFISFYLILLLSTSLFKSSIQLA